PRRAGRRDHCAPRGRRAGDGRPRADRMLHRHGGRGDSELPRGRRGRAPHRPDAGAHRHGLRRARGRRHLSHDGSRAARAPARTVRSGGDVRGVRGILLAALVLATAPLYADYTPFYLGLLTEVLVFGLFALAYDVLLGHAGVLSLGHSAFLGVAAYVTGILLARYHTPLELSILAGAVGGLLTALVLGVFVLRKRGVHLAMLTLALSQVFYFVVLMWTPVTGGTDGLGNLPILYLSEPLGWRLSKRPITRYYVVATVIFLAMLAVRHMLDSPLGRAMRAVKANETRAAACGYDTRRVKLAAFAISGLFSGLAGALLTVVLEFVPIENIHWPMSGTVLIMALFGGTGTLLGPFVGAGVFIWMRDFLSKHLEYWEVFVGGAFVLIVLFLPDGIVGSLNRALARRRPAPTPPADDQVAEPAGLVRARPLEAAAGEPLLESRGLTRMFGGLTAVNA